MPAHNEDIHRHLIRIDRYPELIRSIHMHKAAPVRRTCACHGCSPTHFRPSLIEPHLHVDLRTLPVYLSLVVYNGGERRSANYRLGVAKLRSVVPLLSAELASKSYVRYVTERLKICHMNVRFLKERIYSLRDRAEQLDADEWEVVETYADDIHELLVCLEEMYEEWRDHADSMQTGSSRPRLHSD